MFNWENIACRCATSRPTAKVDGQLLDGGFRPLPATIDMPMDEALLGCDLGRMEDPRPTLPDEVHGARAVSSLVVGDLKSAAAELGSVRTRDLVGFLCRLAMLMPTVS